MELYSIVRAQPILAPKDGGTKSEDHSDMHVSWEWDLREWD